MIFTGSYIIKDFPMSQSLTTMNIMNCSGQVNSYAMKGICWECLRVLLLNMFLNVNGYMA